MVFRMAALPRGHVEDAVQRFAVNGD